MPNDVVCHYCGDPSAPIAVVLAAADQYGTLLDRIVLCAPCAQSILEIGIVQPADAADAADADGEL